MSSIVPADYQINQKSMKDQSSIGKIDHKAKSSFLVPGNTKKE